MQKIKVFINGFGRIGRSIVRVALCEMQDCIEIVGVNDLASPEILSYLLTHDSVHHSKRITQDNDSFVFNGVKIPFSQCKNPSEIDILGADVVIEASGLFLSQSDVESHLQKGAKRVIFSAPAKDATKTFVFGVNHTQYQGEKIISNASCTTNALAPVIMLLDEAFGVEKGILTTIHSYTNDQNLIDAAHRKGDFRRSRAAALNIIPTTTGAAKALHLVLPQMKDKLHGHSVRVPVADVSMVDLNVNLNQSATKEAINALFCEAAEGRLKGILGVDREYGVSQDFLDCPLSGVVALDLTFVLAENMAKIMIWYDNEWGYSHRILEMAMYICKE
ncbi:type I glyceraldehyde-3-phosphate dehydrogenase [Helicobacter sp. MIT 11-5569]|uniref:type I glyceraldehyde-3-phosphate dehydrogenase n=1 Tax=Helicobacter sp. MIT 11-5569 TaxID=1548151 RepID=UPI0010FF2255|nr:type I glyceraldehyde-3-phosphate dehydrogenase [Helicobacter sp. MIT 11-5569]TLD84098.1 type I glyceraldehyde-3-phosphate dehydrogenase [Helicobacter sp. MIT 11-5569]